LLVDLAVATAALRAVGAKPDRGDRVAPSWERADERHSTPSSQNQSGGAKRA
jgi:hypothetical protein